MGRNKGRRLPVPMDTLIPSMLLAFGVASCTLSKNPPLTVPPGTSGSRLLNKTTLEADQNADLAALQGLEIYPEVKNVIKRDGQVFRGVLKLLQEPGWRYKKVGQVVFFYNIEEAEMDAFAINVSQEVKRVQELMNVSNETLDEYHVTVFLLPRRSWERLTSLSSFYLNRTSQIYLEKTASWCGPSTFAHELTHLILRKSRPDSLIPKWLDEGLATYAEEPACFNKRNGYEIKKFREAKEKGTTIPLAKLVSAEFFSDDYGLFVTEAHYVIRFLLKMSAGKSVHEFLDLYLGKEVPTTAEFEQAFSRFTGNKEDLASIERGFLDSPVEEADQNRPAGQFQLTFEPPVLDLGEIRANEVLKRAVSVQNNNAFPVEVEGMEGYITGVTIDVKKKDLLPSETTQLIVTFDAGFNSGQPENNAVFFLTSPQGDARQSFKIRVDILP